MEKEAKVKDAKKCYPYNVSDVNLRDTDSGMRLYRGMSSPWGAIKNFYETYKFTHRLGAEFSVAAFHALRSVFPDYNRLQTLLSDNWGAFMDGCWDPASGQIEPFEDRFDVPPFLKDGQIRAAIYADKGNTMNLISGKIWYTTNDRFEKEIHVCDYDIAGPEACDLSLGGGAHFCYGLAGCPLKAMDPERIGMGDDYCRPSRRPNENTVNMLTVMLRISLTKVRVSGRFGVLRWLRQDLSPGRVSPIPSLSIRATSSPPPVRAGLPASFIRTS